MTSTSAQGSSPVIIAALWMMGTLFSFTLMAISVRELAGAIHSFEILFFRSLGALVLLAPFAIAKGRAALRTGQPRLQIVRNVVHQAAQLGWITGVIALPLSEVFAIEFTTPVWAALIAAVALRERLTQSRAVAVALGFVGILVILRPGISIIEPGALATLAAAVGFAVTIVSTKALTRTDPALTILLYMSLIQLPIGAALATTVWITPSPGELVWLLLVGATGLTAHFCTARALALADATVVVPMDFMRLPLIVAVGAVLYHETAEWLVLLGAVMIFAGNYYSIRREHRRRTPAAG